jgi:hypothetical protein
MLGNSLFFCRMRESVLIGMFILLNTLLVDAQEWIKSFTDGNYAHPSWVIETYDKGYLLSDNESVYSWIIKTDVNGNKLWEKRIGNGLHHIYLENIEQSSDNGFILCGGFGKYDRQNSDPTIIKLNSCGELEWCSVINTVGSYDFGTRVRQTTEGDYILLSQGSTNFHGEDVQLFKFDNNGYLLWKHTYSPDSLIISPEPHDIRVDNDGYLISAMCYYPDPAHPTGGWERPYYIKTDTAGNIIWWLVYGVDTGFHGFTGDETIKSSTGNFYSVGWHSNYCDTPVLVKCMSDGQESYYQDLLPGACPGGNGDINWVDDTTFIVLVGGTLNGNHTTRWIKTDTLGITKYFKESPSWMDATYSTRRTFDNKFVSVARVNDIWIYLYKLNSNLEYDSVYTHQFIYDSLCPGGIISDTINPDCDLIVGIDKPSIESELAKLKIYPNPASGSITVEFPKYLKQTERKSGITSSSVSYQWKSALLEIYNIEGHKILEKEIPKSQTQMELDVSSWPSGMYFFKLSYNGKPVGDAKVIIN